MTHWGVGLVLTAVLCSACAREHPVPRDTAGAKVEQPVARDTMPVPVVATDSVPSIERLTEMATWTYPVADRGTECAPLDPAPTPDTGHVRSFRARERFRCILSPSDTITLLLSADTTPAPDSPGASVSVLGRDGRAVQELNGVQFLPARTPFLVAQDLDFDGVRELKVMAWAGATGNRGWSIHRFDKAAHRLVVDSVLVAVGDPQPLNARGFRCLRSSSKGGHAGMIRIFNIYCWNGARLANVFRVSQDFESAAKMYVRRTWAQTRGVDTLVLMRTVRFPPP